MGAGLPGQGLAATHLPSRGVHEVVEEPHLSWPEQLERREGGLGETGAYLSSSSGTKGRREVFLKPFLTWRELVVLRRNFYFYFVNTLFLFCKAHSHEIFWSITLFLVSGLGPGPVLRFLMYFKPPTVTRSL